VRPLTFGDLKAILAATGTWYHNVTAHQGTRMSARFKTSGICLLLIAVLLTTGCTVIVSRPSLAWAALHSVPNSDAPIGSEQGVRAEELATHTATAVPTPSASHSAEAKEELPVAHAMVTVVVPTPTAPAVFPSEMPPERIIIPAIELDAPVEPIGWRVVTLGESAVSKWEEPPEGTVGWHIDSGLPGRGSNVVISGHHNIKGEVFRNLVNVHPGDEIVLVAGDSVYQYRVREKLILPERDAPVEQRLQNASWMWPTRSERLTLITCWPYETNTHRLIVIAEPTWAEAPKMASARSNSVN